ncbi:MAG: enoyl-CoA hydratase [Rhodocyclaceae bacterium]|nr:enoyl-CoA hydratase [Rhodocyclaceae bacterium]MBX3670577.1 enoyl-CoA hydratase [Rhodocyclaceae bacterium]
MSAVPQADEPIMLRADAAGVATLTLNRPTQFNSLSRALLAELTAELQAIRADASVRVVVITGAGKAFCAGHDLKEMRSDSSPEFQRQLFSECARLMTLITQLPQPVIAKVQGVATAAGCQLVAQCDLAVAAEHVKFAVSGINLGLFCSTPAVALARNIGRKAAFEMLSTGDFITAARARELGLINRIAPAAELDAAVAQLTANLVSKPAISLARGKEGFYRQIEMGLEGAYQYAAETMACNMGDHAAQEGIDAFIDKRPPRWD